jgi:preprotein translocase subunit SecE
MLTKDMMLIDYLKDTRAELRHVTWPTRQQAVTYTIVVLAISIGTGLFLGLLDFVFAKGIAKFI